MSSFKTILLAITFSCFVVTPKMAYAHEVPSMSTPAQAILGAFSIVMFVLPGDLGTIGYRFAMLSPLAVMTAGAATVAWAGIRLIIKNSHDDIMLVF